MKRKSLPPRIDGAIDKEARRAKDSWQCVEEERCTKQKLDPPSYSQLKEKGKARQRIPLLKKKKVVHIADTESSAEERGDDDKDWRLAESNCELNTMVCFCHL